MKTSIRSRGAQVLTVALAACLVTLVSPVAAYAASYPSDTNRPDSLDLLAGYDTIWNSDGRGTMDGQVVDAAAAAHNDEMTVWVNQNATVEQQFRSLQDANYDAALLMAPGLGSTLQPVYLQGMRSGQLPKTRTLMDSMAAYANTDAAKAAFNYPRPFLATDTATTGSACDPASYNASSLADIRAGVDYADDKGNLAIRQVPEMTDSTGLYTDPRTVGVGYGGYCASASFSSGHTTNSYLAGLTLATLLPSAAPGILARVSEMGTDRIVLGMHYPLDVMGGRIAGSAQVAERWADTAYRRDMIDPARDEIVAYLERACGDTVAACASTGTPFSSDPFAGAEVPGGTSQTVTDTASAIDAFQERLTYGFAQTGSTALPASVPDTAAALLLSAYPTLTTAQRTAVVAQTEIESGYPLDRTGSTTGSWQRVDLASALSATVAIGDNGSVDVVSTGGIPTVLPAGDQPMIVLPDGSSVEVGKSFAVAAAGLDARSDYRAVFRDDRATVLGTVSSDAAGGLYGKIAVPADAATGQRTLELLRADGTPALAVDITVIGEQVYQIASEADLDLLRQHPDGIFSLSADIAMTKQWTPVPVFSGELRGNGHVISDLTIVSSGNQGLVVVNDGTIRGLGFIDPVSRLTAAASAGVVAANNNGTVDQVFVRNGLVTGGHRSGLIVSNNWGTVSNSYSTGHASGQWETGGITAWNDGTATVRNNYSSATVTAAYANVGIISGVGNGGAAITGNVVLGGAVLGMSGNASRVVGVGNPTLRDNLVLASTTVNGWVVAGGASDTLQGAPVSAAVLQDAATYAEIGWDFDTVWEWSAEGSRPVLRVVAEPSGTIGLPDSTQAAELAPRAISQARNNLIDDAAGTAALMGGISPAYGDAWKQLLATWDEATTAFRANPTVPGDLPKEGHVFVLLGFALNDDGTARPDLIGRLEQAKAGLDAYPASRIVVTGGAGRNGQTEAGVMRAWLLDHGVAAGRVIFENAATDTPTNAINTMELLYADPTVTSYTIVSSATHLRRATVVFEAAALSAQLRLGADSAPRSVANLAYMDSQIAENPPSIADRELIAQNVAKVWGATVEYDAYNAQVRGMVGRFVAAERSGDGVDALRSISQVGALSPGYAARLSDLSVRWGASMGLTAFFTDPTGEVPAAGHSFIVPGAALNDDGSLSGTSLARLALVVDALKAHPASTVAVVGGAPKNGVTEAGAQRAWLLGHGVDDARIVVVDTSSSLVEGAQQTMLALSARGVESYTVVTSASVLRRTISVYSAGAAYAANNNADGRVLAEAGHLAVIDTAAPADAQPPADEGAARQIAENIADVLGVRGEYNSATSAPPAVAALEGIDVAAPATTSYLVGESLDTAGLGVSARYADGTTLEVGTLATLSGFDSSAPGQSEVTVSFTDRGVTQTAAFRVDVRLADIAELRAAIATAEAIAADGYTADSYAALQSVLNTARAVAADLGSDQTTVSNAVRELRAAVAALVEVPVSEPGGGGIEPGDGGTTPGDGTPGAGIGSPIGGGASVPEVLAMTGAPFAAAVLVLGLLLTLGGAAVVRTRRRLAS